MSRRPSFSGVRGLTFSMLATVFLVTATPAQLLPDQVDNLGGGLAGVSGIPSMDVSGMLAPGETVVFTVDNAAPNADAVFVIGSYIANVPWFGGIIIPYPDITVPVATDSAGHGETSFVWPQGLMGVTAYVQWTVEDSAAVQGWSISNAMSVHATDSTLSSPSGVWGKLNTTPNKKSIRLEKTNTFPASVTSWYLVDGTDYYTDGNGGTLSIWAGPPKTVTVSAGSIHAGNYIMS